MLFLVLKFVVFSGNSRLNILSIYQKSRIIGRAIDALFKQGYFDWPYDSLLNAHVLTFTIACLDSIDINNSITMVFHQYRLIKQR